VLVFFEHQLFELVSLLVDGVGFLALLPKSFHLLEIKIIQEIVYLYLYFVFTVEGFVEVKFILAGVRELINYSLIVIGD